MLAVIIPIYNEGNRAVDTIKNVFDYIGKKDMVIAVDDGSNDNSWDLIKKIDRNSLIRLRHVINLGKGAAMKTGVEAAWKYKADRVLFLDGDGQHNPKYIEEFKKELEKYPVVFGRRRLGVEMPLVRRWGNVLSIELIKTLFKIRRGDILCGYFGFNKSVYHKIIWKSPRYGVETEIATRVGKNAIPFSEVNVDTIYIDKYKGVTIIDALKILFKLPEWYFRK